MNSKIRKLAIAVMGFMLAASAVADHHETGPLGYGQAFGLNVSDPAALLAAMNKYRNSAVGKKIPSSVTLSQAVANGDSEVTHIINVFYQSAGDMDKTRAIAAGSRERAAFGKSLRQVSDRHFANLFTFDKARIKEGAVTSNNAATMVFGLAVTNPAAFMSAFEKLWESDAAQAFPGNAFFGTGLAGGDSNVTHFVSFQANDMATLLNGVQALQSSAAMAAYLSAASSARTVEGRSVSARLKTWEPTAQ